jgi:hypothetical protein
LLNFDLVGLNLRLVFPGRKSADFVLPRLAYAEIEFSPAEE